MTSNPALAALQAEIERREDEIFAIREVMAMLGAAPPVQPQPAALALPKPEAKPKAKPQVKSGAAPVTSGTGRVMRFKDCDGEATLNAREERAFLLLEGGEPVSAGAMEEIFGAGPARHQGVHYLKRKLETCGRSLAWQKGQGYSLIRLGHGA